MENTWITANEAHIESIGVIKDIILQIIIFSTTLLAFTITFIEKLKHLGNQKASKNWIVFSWLSFMTSIIIGCIALFKLAGFLIDYSNECNLKPSILNLMFFQFIFFCFAISLISIFAIKSILDIEDIIKQFKTKKS